MTFAVYLSQIRRATGMNQREFARALGVTGQYINDLEHGRRNPPPVEMCQKIATVTGTPVDLLYYYRGVLPPDTLGCTDEETVIRAFQILREELTR